MILRHLLPQTRLLDIVEIIRTVLRQIDINHNHQDVIDLLLHTNHVNLRQHIVQDVQICHHLRYIQGIHPEYGFQSSHRLGVPNRQITLGSRLPGRNEAIRWTPENRHGKDFEMIAGAMIFKGLFLRIVIVPGKTEILEKARIGNEGLIGTEVAQNTVKTDTMTDSHARDHSLVVHNVVLTTATVLITQIDLIHTTDFVALLHLTVGGVLQPHFVMHPREIPSLRL